MEPDELFRQGDLRGAIDALTPQVKAAPTDIPKRALLFELLCFAGDLDRAGRQLDVIGQQDPGADAGAQVYRNLLHAEHTRRRVFADGLPPEFLLDQPPWVAHHLEALTQLGRGNRSAAVEALERAEGARAAVAGVGRDGPFDDIADWDELIAPFLEFMLLRDYIWIPFEQLRDFEILRPEKPRDLIWAPARLTLANGAPHRGYVPVLYCGSHEHAEDAVKLGRTTDWSPDDESPLRGFGHRILRLGERDVPLLEVGRVTISARNP